MKKYLILTLFVFCSLVCFTVTGQTDNSNVPAATTVTEQADHVVASEAVTYNAEMTPQQEIEQTIFVKIWDGFLQFIDYVNWLFVVVFMVLTWLIGDYSQAVNKASWLDWLGKVPRLLLAFGVGLALIGVFYWGFDYDGKADVMHMLFSILASLVFYKIGVDKLFRWFSTYVLKIKLPDDKTTVVG